MLVKMIKRENKHQNSLNTGNNKQFFYDMMLAQQEFSIFPETGLNLLIITDSSELGHTWLQQKMSTADSLLKACICWGSVIHGRQGRSEVWLRFKPAASPVHAVTSSVAVSQLSQI